MDDHKHNEGNSIVGDQLDMDCTAISMGISDDIA